MIFQILALVGAIGGIKYFYDSYKDRISGIIPTNVSSKAKDILPDIKWD